MSMHQERGDVCGFTYLAYGGEVRPDEFHDRGVSALLLFEELLLKKKKKKKGGGERSSLLVR